MVTQSTRIAETMELAAKATPSKWRAYRHVNSGRWNVDNSRGLSVVDCGGAEAYSAANAAYIANLDPAFVLDLCAAAARAEAMEAALRFYNGAWSFKVNQRYGGLEWQPTEALLDDCGNIARAALTPPVPDSIDPAGVLSENGT